MNSDKAIYFLYQHCLYGLGKAIAWHGIRRIRRGPIDCFLSDVGWLLSPTFELARCLKAGKGKDGKSKIIKALNSLYLLFAIFGALGLLVFESVIQNHCDVSTAGYLSGICVAYLLSRCNEIFYSFLKDAIDKSQKPPDATSSLTPVDRIKLALKSYFELIIDFAIIYSLLPAFYWNECKAPDTILEALYFSEVTITTLGYGDISPKHPFLQLLTVYEVLCGFILLIVCFTIYTNLNSKKGCRCQGKDE